MIGDDQEQDRAVVPPVPLDTVFSDLVDDALCGPALPEEADSERRLTSDPHDFAGLYIRHRASFGLHARRYLKDKRDVEEVVQEGFLRLFLALPELETELQALAYCRRTITNLCIDRYRADQRRPRLVDLDSVPVDQLAEDLERDGVIQAEDAAQVRLALSLLSPAHRDALVKREIEEKSLPVIAAELDIPEESVKHLLFRARRALRRLLAGTQLQPGTDPELTSTLQLLARRTASAGGRVAGVAAILLIALGSGPNLHAIPLVGTDLPDLPSILQLARPDTGPAAPAPTHSFRPASGPVPLAPRGTVLGPAVPRQPAIIDPVPSLPMLPSPLISPATGPTPMPSPQATPSPVAIFPLPSVAPSPSLSPSQQPSSSPSASPSASAKPSASAPASASPSPTAAAASAGPKATAPPAALTSVAKS